MSPTTAAMSAPAAKAEHARAPGVMPPMATRGRSPISFFHSASRAETLRRPRHLLQPGRVDRAERHIVGIDGEALVELGMVVGADAEPDAGAAQRRHVGLGKILLAEMDVVAALVDRDLPVVVDDELAAARRRRRSRPRGTCATQLGVGRP